MNRYGPKAQRVIEDTLKRFDKGELKSGKTGKKVTDRDQAVAIGISEARSKHYKVPINRN